MAKWRRKLKEDTAKLLWRFPFILVVYFTVIVINQDLLIFPGAVRSLFHKSVNAPSEVSEYFLDTPDRRKVNVWSLAADRQSEIKKKVVVMFHGNGDDLQKFYSFQEWFREQGYTSYDFDYAGYGKSTGWMSEKNIYHDAERVLKFAAAKENIPSSDVVVFGLSIGTGPAAYAAQLFQSKTVILIAGYSSIPDVVRTRPLFWFLTSFLRYEFPNARNLEKLKNSCVVIAHGKKDEVIGYDNALRLIEAGSKNNTVKFVSSEIGHHNDTFWEKSVEISQALEQCFAQR